MPRYNVFSRDSNSIMGEVDAPTSTQACQKVAGRIRHIYPKLPIAVIASKLYAYKVDRQGFGGRPRLFG